MLANIFVLMGKDIRTGTRDQIMAYMLLAPLLLGALAALLLPLLEHAPLVFAVSADLPAEHVEALRNHGRVEILPDRAAVEARVRLRDNVPGIVPTAMSKTVQYAGTKTVLQAAGDDALNAIPSAAPDVVPEAGAVTNIPEIIVQGDESAAIADLPGYILDHAARVRAGLPVTDVTIESLEREDTGIRRIAAALLAYSVVVMVGLLLGFTILEERMTGIDALLAVSPLSFVQYAAAKLGLAALLSLVLVFPVLMLPLGTGFGIGTIAGLLAVTVASLPFALTLGLLIGAWAKDQLGAITVMKALLPVWLSLPVAGFLVGAEWGWLLAPFGNHWSVQSFYEMLQDGGSASSVTWRAAGLAFVTGLPVLLFTLRSLRRQLGFANGSD